MTDPVPSLEHLDRHVLILNVNEKVRRIVEEIVVGSAPDPPEIVILVQDRDLWRANPSWHPLGDGSGRLHVVEGCPAEPDDLQRIRIDRAAAAVILADPRRGGLADAHSTLVAVAIEQRNPQVHTVIELISSVHRVHLRGTEVNEVICLGEITEKLIAQSCITPGIHRVFRSLLAARPGTGQVFVVEVPARLQGLSYRELARRAVVERLPFVPCGYALDSGGQGGPGSGRGATFVLNPRAGEEPGRDTVLGGGDRLVVIAYSRPDLEAAVAVQDA